MNILQNSLQVFLSIDFKQSRLESGCINRFFVGTFLLLLFIILSNLCVFNFIIRINGHECGTHSMYLNGMCKRPWYSCLNMESIAKIYMHVKRKPLGYRCKWMNICNVAKSTFANIYKSYRLELLCGFAGTAEPWQNRDTVNEFQKKKYLLPFNYDCVCMN